MMKKIVAVLILCVGFAAFVPGEGFSATPAEALTAMKTAREKLVALLDTSDKGTQSVLIDEIHKASDAADKALDAVIADASTSAEVKAKVTEAKSVWGEFKKTREEEIIPAVKSGVPAKGKELAGSIQKERFKKLLSLLQ